MDTLIDLKYPYHFDSLSVGRYQINGTFDAEVSLSVTQSTIPYAHLIDGKEIILESFSINHERGTYVAKIHVRENIIPLIAIAASLVGGGIFLNQANTTIDRVSKLAIISIPVVIGAITFLVILKK